MHNHSFRVSTNAVLLGVFLACTMAPAQSQLPAPSRTIYKCQVKGTVSYSDEPCAGAQRLDVTPTRGVSRLSGSSRTGKDVASEIHTEQMAAAFRPLSGMNASEYATAGRRGNLSSTVQRECRQLEPGILSLEQAESRANPVTIQAIQQNLLTLRKRYKTLSC
jgi:hypothetical protein